MNQSTTTTLSERGVLQKRYDRLVETMKHDKDAYSSLHLLHEAEAKFLTSQMKELHRKEKTMLVAPTKHERINQELKEAGMSVFGLRRFSSRYLPRIIHEDEHIEAVVAGRRRETEAFFGYMEGMLVATDLRVIYLDHRLGWTTMDEFTYDVISGVNLTIGGIAASVTLYTKVGNYLVGHASVTCASKFADYIEQRRIDSRAIEKSMVAASAY